VMLEASGRSLPGEVYAGYGGSTKNVAFLWLNGQVMRQSYA
jgi:hypothetical protein